MGKSTIREIKRDKSKNGKYTIQKTKAIKECLHRFCGECIEKSMRLCNSECPICRTHYAGQSSLKDDVNYDALISFVSTRIGKYEEEELSLHEDEKKDNKL
ncbi:PREDICTED: putative E3 ubiquitin-protein ligase RING1a [Lupinus angustifolius]|uniref:putative E3 ubiquitin-protein ligase RING1a n=1 Tax=Lupinus angustifolius TaxID=3871 RepID=UPI00092EC138|nr:PREDICTED: putative E3 ubiquitin-protein ligase RING1a [Lupinus angustifolius]